MIGMLKNLLHLKKPKTPQKSIDERISDLYDSLQVDVLAVAFGDDILPYAQNIVNGIGKFRIKLKDQSGFIIPPIRVINDKSLQENEIHILVRGHVVYSDFAVPTKEYVLKSIMTNLSSIATKNVSDIFSNGEFLLPFTFLSKKHILLFVVILYFIIVLNQWAF